MSATLHLKTLLRGVSFAQIGDDSDQEGSDDGFSPLGTPCWGAQSDDEDDDHFALSLGPATWCHRESTSISSMTSSVDDYDELLSSTTEGNMCGASVAMPTLDVYTPFDSCPDAAGSGDECELPSSSTLEADLESELPSASTIEAFDRDAFWESRLHQAIAQMRYGDSKVGAEDLDLSTQISTSLDTRSTATPAALSRAESPDSDRQSRPSFAYHCDEDFTMCIASSSVGDVDSEACEEISDVPEMPACTIAECAADSPLKSASSSCCSLHRLSENMAARSPDCSKSSTLVSTVPSLAVVDTPTRFPSSPEQVQFARGKVAEPAGKSSESMWSTETNTPKKSIPVEVVEVTPSPWPVTLEVSPMRQGGRPAGKNVEVIDVEVDCSLIIAASSRVRNARGSRHSLLRSSTARAVHVEVLSSPEVRDVGNSVAGSSSSSSSATVRTESPQISTPSCSLRPSSNKTSIGEGEFHVANLAPSYENFLWLHNTVAMPLMKRTGGLAMAYKHLNDANALHMQACGVPSSAALYNVACCLALAAEAQRSSPALTELNCDVAAGLPPVSVISSHASIVQTRLDLSIAALEAAIRAGYIDAANMQVDPDLRIMRELRADQFRSALLKASGKEAGHPVVRVPRMPSCSTSHFSMLPQPSTEFGSLLRAC